MDAQQSFKQELDALLEKYKVTFEIENDGFGWSSSQKMVATAYAEYNDDGEVVKEGIDMDMGAYYSGE